MRKCICIVVRHEDRFLLVKHTKGKWKDKWFFPGLISDEYFEMKENSSLQEDLLRLLYFQTGYLINIKRLLFSEYYCEHKGGDKALYIYISGSIDGGTLKKNYSKHSAETKWLTGMQMKGLNMVLNVPEAVTRYRQIFRWLDIYSMPSLRPH